MHRDLTLELRHERPEPFEIRRGFLGLVIVRVQDGDSDTAALQARAREVLNRSQRSRVAFGELFARGQEFQHRPIDWSCHQAPPLSLSVSTRPSSADTSS